MLWVHHMADDDVKKIAELSPVITNGVDDDENLARSQIHVSHVDPAVAPPILALTF